jgi:hypothetical protein
MFYASMSVLHMHRLLNKKIRYICKEQVEKKVRGGL